MILFLYGAGGAATEVCDMVIRNDSIRHRYGSLVFIDDFADEGEFYGCKRIKFDSVEAFRQDEDAEFVITVGEPSSRRALREKVSKAGYRLATLIDETATVSPSAVIGEGSIITFGTIIASNVKIGQNCYLTFRVTIGHGAVIEDDTLIAGQALVGADCHVGSEVFIGVMSCVKPHTDIGDRAIVGMGSAVFRSVEQGGIVMGNPARPTKGNTLHKVFL